jgi:hypothetical protein
MLKSLRIGAVLLILGTGGAWAKAPDQIQEMIDSQKAMIHLAPENLRCPRDVLNDAIVVCARDESPRYRIPSTQEENPGSDTARKTGQWVPPDVSGLPKCGVCIRGGWAPPPVYYVDVTRFPEAPVGSDAWKIAHGEMPAP